MWRVAGNYQQHRNYRWSTANPARGTVPPEGYGSIAVSPTRAKDSLPARRVAGNYQQHRNYRWSTANPARGTVPPEGYGSIAVSPTRAKDSLPASSECSAPARA